MNNTNLKEKNNNNSNKDGSHSPTTRICGIRARYFWILLGLIIVAIALGVGLGVGLTRHHGGGGSSSTDNSNSNGAIGTLTQLSTKYNLPALGVGYDNGSSFHDAVVGVRKVGTDINATTADTWHFGSNTKAMTATVVALLIQDGLLMWTSSLGDLLSSSNITDVLQAYRNVTVQQLTSHTSSISDTLSHDEGLALYNLTAAAGRVQAATITLSTPPSHAQGTFTYANMNYILLGVIIGQVTHLPPESVFQSRLFTPLNLTSAGFGPNPEPSLTSVTNPWPHVGSANLGFAGAATPVSDALPFKYRDNPPAFNTAGGVHMSMSDYAAWLRVHFDPAAQKRLNLSAASVKMLHQSYPNTNTSDPGYGFTYGGWMRIDSTLQASEGDGYQLVHDGSNTLNYASAVVNIGVGSGSGNAGLNGSVFAVTNVGGQQIVPGAAWVQGTHEARQEVLAGSIVFT